MSTLEQDAAKRAAAGESLGAFVTLDMRLLDRDELIMLGMREALAKYLGIIATGLDNARLSNNLPMVTAIMQLQKLMQDDHDKITVRLTKSAMRHRSATVQEIPKEPQ